MIKRLNLKEVETAKEVLALQKASYRVEADILNYYEIPPLKDSIHSLKACDEIFYGYYIYDILAGIISYKIIGNILNIYRVAVHPHFFRMGIGGILLNYIENVEENITRIIVHTGKKNLPGINLYLKNGYQIIKEIEICKGIYLTVLEKLL